MKWNAENDARLAALTGSAESVLEKASLAEMLGRWPEMHMLRVKGDDGRAVWLSRRWHANPHIVFCLGVAPWNVPFAADVVRDEDWFAAGAPIEMLTKSRAGFVEKDWTNGKRNMRRTPWKTAQWAVALYPVEGKPKSRRCVLYRVVESDERRPLWVQPFDYAPAVEAVRLRAALWVPQAEYVEGYEKRWKAEDTEAPSYLVHVLRSRAAAGVKVERKPKKAKG